MILVTLTSNNLEIDDFIKRNTKKNVFDDIIIGDLKNFYKNKTSSDYTTINCEGMSKSQALNNITNLTKGKIKLFINEFEEIIQFKKFYESNGHVNIIYGDIVSKELRLWTDESKWENPIYESLNAESDNFSNIFVSSKDMKYDNEFDKINEWIKNDPFSTVALYYKAMFYLKNKQYDEFIKTSDEYFFNEKRNTVSSVMLRYYYALAFLVQKNQVKSAMQNLTICIAENPTMSDFWCALGDIYFHYLKNYNVAIEHYRNAEIFGRKRSYDDKFPINIYKSSDYPNKKIKECLEISKLLLNG